MRGRQGRRTNDQARIRAVELQPDFNTIQVRLVENIKDIKIFTKGVNTCIHYIYDKTDTRVVHGRP